MPHLVNLPLEAAAMAQEEYLLQLLDTAFHWWGCFGVAASLLSLLLLAGAEGQGVLMQQDPLPCVSVYSHSSKGC
jgi:hypothetical protein